MTTNGTSDERFMDVALALARRGRGNVSPNPPVGCVLAREGIVVGRGWTQPGGRPHAETEALARAGGKARGATAYVTLEPCSHHGMTPPCADALIAAGVARVVIGASDPDPRVAGRGVAKLREAGIEVAAGVRLQAAENAAAGFLKRLRAGRPLVTLKLATTLDGRIADSAGVSKWITGPQARAEAHALRARNDAVLVGGRTAAADDPELTCRLPGLRNRTPIRIVLGGRLTPKLAATAHEAPVWHLVAPGAATEELAVGERLEVPADAEGALDPEAALRLIAERGVNRLMVEGGGRAAAALLRRDLVDRLVWFRAPSVIGGDGVPAVAAFGARMLDDPPAFVRVSVRPAGRDLIETYERSR